VLFFFLDLLVYFFLFFFSHSFFSFSSPLITYVSHSFFSQEKATAEANKATAEKDKAACESEAATEQISRDTVLNACITSFGSSKSVYENHVQELADVAAMRKVLDEHLAPLIPGDTGAGGESNNGAGGESNNGAGGGAYVKTANKALSGNGVWQVCSLDKKFEYGSAGLEACESKCNQCADCQGFVDNRDNSPKYCVFKGGEDVVSINIYDKPSKDWYAKPPNNSGGESNNGAGGESNNGAGGESNNGAVAEKTFFHHPAEMACKRGGSWKRPYGNVKSTKAGFESCGSQCKAGGFKYFGLECPSHQGSSWHEAGEVHCQCASELSSSNKQDPEQCSGGGNKGHCNGPFVTEEGGYSLGGHGLGSVYSVA